MTTFKPNAPTGENVTEILIGAEAAVGRGIHFMSKAKKMDIFFDKNAPSIVVGLDDYRNGYLQLRKRGGKIRAFTEITRDNLKHCKELMRLVDELRHLDRVAGGIAVTDTEYMATMTLQENTPLAQVIYSNEKKTVEQGQQVFNMMWEASIPAAQRIRDIEASPAPK